MAKKPAPYKQRTRAHVLEALSVHHVEGFLLRAGHTVQRFDDDYGYDLFATFDAQGYAEPGVIYFQLKATESHKRVKDDVVFDLDVRDYNKWMQNEMPVILVLYEAITTGAVWLPVQDYFRADVGRRPRKGAKTVRVRIPITQVLDESAIATMRELKRIVVEG